MPAARTPMKTADGSRERLASLLWDALRRTLDNGSTEALPAIRLGDRVLVLGACRGLGLLLAAKLAGPDGRAITLASSPDELEPAPTSLSNVEVLPGSPEALPLAGAVVDVVISGDDLTSLDRGRWFQESYRVLRAGGRIFLSSIAAEPLPDWIAEVSSVYPVPFVGAVPASDRVRELEQAGFCDVHVVEQSTLSERELGGVLGVREGASCCCEGGGLPKVAARRMAHDLAGKVSLVGITGRKAPR